MASGSQAAQTEDPEVPDDILAKHLLDGPWGHPEYENERESSLEADPGNWQPPRVYENLNLQDEINDRVMAAAIRVQNEQAGIQETQAPPPLGEEYFSDDDVEYPEDDELDDSIRRFYPTQLTDYLDAFQSPKEITGHFFHVYPKARVIVDELEPDEHHQHLFGVSVRIDYMHLISRRNHSIFPHHGSAAHSQPVDMHQHFNLTPNKWAIPLRAKPSVCQHPIAGRTFFLGEWQKYQAFIIVSKPGDKGDRVPSEVTDPDNHGLRILNTSISSEHAGQIIRYINSILTDSAFGLYSPDLNSNTDWEALTAPGDLLREARLHSVHSLVYADLRRLFQKIASGWTAFMQNLGGWLGDTSCVFSLHRYGQDTTFNPSKEVDQQSLVQYFRAFELDDLDTIIFALASNVKGYRSPSGAENPKDPVHQVGLLSKHSRVRQAFQKAKVDFYPLACLKTLGNFQSRKVPQFISKEITSLLTRLERDDITSGADPAIIGVGSNCYSGIKRTMRPSPAEYAYQSGTYTASMAVNPGTAASDSKKHKDLQKAAKDNDPQINMFRAINAAKAKENIHFRFEFTYAVHMTRIAREHRTAESFVNLLFKKIATFVAVNQEEVEKMLVFIPCHQWPEALLASLLPLHIAIDHIRATTAERPARTDGYYVGMEMVSWQERMLRWVTTGSRKCLLPGAWGPMELYTSLVDHGLPYIHPQYALVHMVTLVPERWPHRDGLLNFGFAAALSYSYGSDYGKAELSNAQLAIAMSAASPGFAAKELNAGTVKPFLKNVLVRMVLPQFGLWIKKGLQKELASQRNALKHVGDDDERRNKSDILSQRERALLTWLDPEDGIVCLEWEAASEALSIILGRDCQEGLARIARHSSYYALAAALWESALKVVPDTFERASRFSFANPSRLNWPQMFTLCLKQARSQPAMRNIADATWIQMIVDILKEELLEIFPATINGGMSYKTFVRISEEATFMYDVTAGGGTPQRLAITPVRPVYNAPDPDSVLEIFQIQWRFAPNVYPAGWLNSVRAWQSNNNKFPQHLNFFVDLAHMFKPSILHSHRALFIIANIFSSFNAKPPVVTKVKPVELVIQDGRRNGTGRDVYVPTFISIYLYMTRDPSFDLRHKDKKIQASEIVVAQQLRKVNTSLFEYLGFGKRSPGDVGSIAQPKNWTPASEDYWRLRLDRAYGYFKRRQWQFFLQEMGLTHQLALKLLQDVGLASMN